MRNICAAFIVLGCGAVVDAQQTHLLTDAEVTAAIERGYATKHHPVGLELVEGGGSCNTCPNSGYEIIIYTPAQWIEAKAMKAKRELTTYTIADVTPEMRQPLLHIVAWPDLPNTLGGVPSASNVHKVVLADETKQILIQPLSNEPEAVKVATTFSDKSYNKDIVTFAMEDVSKVRGSSGDGEFYVVVAGDTHTKFFKVKSKMFSHLF
jgi:hypothetical protein